MTKSIVSPHHSSPPTDAALHRSHNLREAYKLRLFREMAESRGRTFTPSPTQMASANPLTGDLFFRFLEQVSTVDRRVAATLDAVSAHGLLEQLATHRWNDIGFVGRWPFGGRNQIELEFKTEHSTIRNFDFRHVVGQDPAFAAYEVGQTHVRIPFESQADVFAASDLVHWLQDAEGPIPHVVTIEPRLITIEVPSPD